MAGVQSRKGVCAWELEEEMEYIQYGENHDYYI